MSPGPISDSYGGPVTRRGPRVLLFVQTGDERPKVWRGEVRNFDTHGMAALTHRACDFKRTVRPLVAG